MTTLINDGIYEQIINTKLQNELNQIDISAYDIDLDKLDADDARKVLTIYISYILQKGLRYVRDGYGSSKADSEEALIKQIQLCNSIIDEITNATGEKDFDDLKILEKGEILRSLYQKINTARAISNMKVVRPETSLLESTLFTGAKQEPTMLSEIKKEIVSSDSVDLLISFIKWSAIVKIMPDLKEFTSREGTRLRVIATTYMKATDYKAIVELSKLPNTEIKINYETNQLRMHAKSYIFKRNTGFSTVYIGSSNLSNPALTEGLEWNVKVTEQESFDIVKKCQVTFESYWNNSSFETFDYLDEECDDKLRGELAKISNFENSKMHLLCSIRPYPYQQEILDNLEAERNIFGHYKNLVVASTGVGKTVIAAFDFRRFREENPNAKLLFIAHRKEILEQSIQKFREVLNDFNFGDLYVDGNRPKQIDHLFMSIQSFVSSGFQNQTSDDYYDYIIVDEFHHAAANSYSGLLNYYKPKILLGLTATPERLDGKDITEYFDGRIASEMRLGEAIDRKLLSPFLYFGVSDSIDYSHLTWRGKYDINELERIYTADTKRASLVLNTVFQYVNDISEVHGLGFCVSIAHAEFMAKYFNEHGVPSIALSSKSVDDIRADAKKDLVDGTIKFIFVVDLYNEGVDIPQVNTVLFLRPTESATVFLQQLGRGLRLHPDKECLTVLDFIGQAHKKYNFSMKFRSMIGKSRKSVREEIETGFESLPRGCYIQLEKMAKEYVLSNLKQTAVDKRTLIDQVKHFTEDTSLPLTLDYFLDYHGINLIEFYRSDGSRSLHRLKMWAGLIADTQDVDNAIYKKFSSLLFVNSKTLLEYWIAYIETNKMPESERERLMRNMLYYSFYQKEPAKEGYPNMNEAIADILQYDFVKDEILQILRYNLKHIDFVPRENSYQYECPLEVHCNYNSRQILAAYGYYNELAAPEFREGVKYLEDKKTDLFLINLNKSEKDFSPSTMYDDYALNEELFHWQTQSGLSADSNTAKRYIEHAKNNNHISLFVREFKKTGTHTSSYVFLGDADYVSHEGSKPISFVWHLKNKIPANLIQKANKSVAI
ncbi:DEAD/DEAH box helicase [Agathobacter ruminis]|uniref:DEAD/DEAH box helicase n=1 Tax=Agathobacter ruminis TaxID=1712665 RepID=UPI002E8E0689|nr:DUF3427 domain-containing protein [Agathobacter ruminis]